MKYRGQRFEMEVRDTRGNVLGYGGGEDFSEVLHRTYRKNKLGNGKRVGLHEYFMTNDGFPYGTHHVQMVSKNGVLDPKVVVHVR